MSRKREELTKSGFLSLLRYEEAGIPGTTVLDFALVQLVDACRQTLRESGEKNRGEHGEMKSIQEREIREDILVRSK